MFPNFWLTFLYVLIGIADLSVDAFMLTRVLQLVVCVL